LSLTFQKVRSAKNPPETIIDKTPEKDFNSPLKRYVQAYCEICDYNKGRCRLHDQNGMKTMELCIMLYCNETQKGVMDFFSHFNAPTKTPEQIMTELEPIEEKEINPT